MARDAKNRKYSALPPLTLLRPCVIRVNVRDGIIQPEEAPRILLLPDVEEPI